MVAIARALLNDNGCCSSTSRRRGSRRCSSPRSRAALERAAELTTILLVEQNLAVVARLARDVVVLDSGRVVHAGPAPELLADPEHVRRLLGVHGGAH